MSTAALRLQARAIQNKVTVLSAINLNWRLIYFMAFMCSLAMLLLYIFGINALTQGTYTIKNYNKEVKSLLAENRNLQIDANQTSYLGLTQQKAQELNFQKSTNITYVHVLQDSFAKAD
ncbi:hypothetical protein KW786_01895 [Candidatus Parcubacteria bacterium]|nr:hypothetical protein [Candidatus Parcubacteria bacterium]